MNRRHATFLDTDIVDVSILESEVSVSDLRGDFSALVSICITSCFDLRRSRGDDTGWDSAEDMLLIPPKWKRRCT